MHGKTVFRGTFQPSVPNAAASGFSFANPMAEAARQPAKYGKLPPLQRARRVAVPTVLAPTPAEVAQLLSPTLPEASIAGTSVVAPSVWQSAVNATSGKTYYYKNGETRWNNPNAPEPIVTTLEPVAALVEENALPAGWKSATTNSGKTYFYHNQGKKTWKKPVLPSGWQTAVNGEGRSYYYKGSETSWDWPEENAEAEAAATAAVIASNVAAAVATVAESANRSTKKELKNEMKNIGLSTEGTKKELVATVRDAVAPAAEQAAAATKAALAAAGGGAVQNNNRSDDQILAELTRLLTQYEIRPDFLQRALQLDEFEIALILDNSSSMFARSDAPMPASFEVPAYASKLRLVSSTAEGGGGYNMGAPDLTDKRLFWSRWTELMHIAKILIPIANVFDKSGVDLYFFDRDTINNYTDSTNFETIAGMPDSPTGTPLTETLKKVLADKADMPLGKKLLIFIITDGEPNGGIYAFKEALLRKRENVYVSILACNSDEGAIGYLNDIDDTVPRVDCVDDYTSERKEILDVQGDAFPFSYGDYIIKALLGAVDPAFDNLDEKNLLADAYVVKAKDHYSVAKGSTSLTMVSSVAYKKWAIGTRIMLKSPGYRQPPTYGIDVVTITSISRDGRTIRFTPALQYTHKTYNDCGAGGCLPKFWGGRTRRRLAKSKTRRNKNKRTRHKSRR